ncbi:tetratricopeptide repeat protein [Nitrosospira multiformis]|uniref:Tetratricopeptide repeat-containing protein n=1 Tax=Nitrosospira multiformis TaxID=1231 RepID=A0A1I7GCK5_9PROT|nr:tetratricopeptide repeat protein [Nitrosospira multiformis]SFU46160.1 Tetratricopeptide repeat-containing protein [Nitrosospira multiformis]
MKAMYVTAIIISAVFTNVQAAPHCGELTTAYGPYDYTNADHRKKLGVVEQFHFTPNIEKLIKGENLLGDDIHYTLAASPNHHRALDSMAQLSFKEKNIRPAGAKYSIHCYFERAIRFKPSDAMVRMVYSKYLIKAGHPKEAAEQLQIAVDLQPEDPTINYNVGLLYLKQKNYEQAKTYAKKAYELGFPLPGLKNQLKQAGKWDE